MKNRIWEGLLDRLYPSGLYCISCRKIIDQSRGYGLCNECMDNIKWSTGRLCDKCGKPLSVNNPGYRCFNCREHAHEFDHGYTCTEYGANERSIVFAMKYDDRPDMARYIGRMMADRMLAEFGPDELAARYDLLVPVPVSDRRRNDRGYNQAELLAKFYAEETGTDFNGEILCRIRETGKMKGLSPAERRENVRGCFAVREGMEKLIEGASCLVIDDIYTTGATIDEIAVILKASGAQRVDFLSFANGADVVK